MIVVFLLFIALFKMFTGCRIVIDRLCDTYQEEFPRISEKISYLTHLTEGGTYLQLPAQPKLFVHFSN